MLARLALTAALALLAVRCDGAPPAPVPPSPAAQPGITSGCQSADRLGPGTHRLAHDGLSRRFLLALPGGDDPHPLILDLHGLNSTAARQNAYSRLAEHGTSRGYIVATPQAADGHMGWTLPRTAGPDDTGFLTALLAHLGRRLCVRADRQFAAGMSYGAAMATGLICALDGKLSAVAAVAGINIARPCRPPAPTTIIAFHGTGDRIVPYDGGHPFRDATGDLRELAGLIVLDPVERATAGWADLLGCTGPAATTPAPRVRLHHWTCPGATLRLYTIAGGGHTWPGAMPVPRLGHTTRNLDATRLILDAFDRAPSR
ncbi:hypothetical protein ABZW11_41410 [Nonomuraea sp. NPDC004580]|uniref:alpha/beta hydrolase family esterase n=1 Tax=Nonomuraea sp. NPDC004580 TaxID=3154552 RepID=UPI0033B225AB